MHVSLTPELEAGIKAKVETGLYNNASEVIREALRFVETHEEWIYQVKLDQLRIQLAKGIEQLDKRKGIIVQDKIKLKTLFKGIRKAAHKDMK